MRIAPFIGAFAAASGAIATSSGDASIWTGKSSAIWPSIPAVIQSSPDLDPVLSANATAPLATTTSSTTTPNATTSHAAELTGGAIPQQMQASMAGLLGFCIMGLVML